MPPTTTIVSPVMWAPGAAAAAVPGFPTAQPTGLGIVGPRMTLRAAVPVGIDDASRRPSPGTTSCSVLIEKTASAWPGLMVVPQVRVNVNSYPFLVYVDPAGGQATCSGPDHYHLNRDQTGNHRTPTYLRRTACHRLTPLRPIRDPARPARSAASHESHGACRTSEAPPLTV
jgi:hypothetical protein